MMTEAGYKDCIVQTYRGEFRIAKSWLSEPDGYGGRLLDINLDLGDGRGWTIANISTENVESMIVTPTDPWGRRIVEAFDGHDSFGCNNHDCEQHPHSLYGKKDTRTGELL